jgi:hypothetical protein
MKQAALSPNANYVDLQGDQFGSIFFGSPGAQSPPNEGVYEPKWLNGQDPASVTLRAEDKAFLYWKSDEESAKERTFDAAKVDVEKAWKLGKARDLAQKAADELQKQVQEKGLKELPQLRDFAEAQNRPLIEVGPISKLEASPSQSPQQATQYHGPMIPSDKVAYPTADFAEKLVDMREKPIGETIVLRDAPRKNFYVGVLTEKSEPSQLVFEMTYARSFPRFGMGGDTLLSLLQLQRATKFYTDTMEQLRKDSGLNIKNPDFLKDRRGESNNDSE